jgi:anti-sigma regulatory factor (Ser/Thr protein kinase)
VTASPIEPLDSEESVSMRIAGGSGAPRRARRSVLTQLEGRVADTTLLDAALAVSELVTNSVVHANVGAGGTLTVELTRIDGRLRVAVIDPGSGREPRLLPPDPRRPNGLGILVVDKLSAAWGVTHDGIGSTRVWCDLPL